jgi:hypothetical protein
MKTSNISWSVKQYHRMYEKGTISFDYPIQRKGEQWDSWKKSLLIHSLMDRYPVPSFYSIKDEDIYFILDGKQRLTTIFNYINNKFKLHKDTPMASIDGETFDVSGKTFDELDEEVQDQIFSYMLTNYKLDEATDEEIEELFFRLNNGSPLSKQQKSKAIMGTEWATKLNALVDHPFIKEKSAFTAAQLRNANDETAILQTMMLMDDNHELKSISSNEVFEYTKTLKRDKENKLKIVNRLEKTFDYLNQTFEKKEKFLTKKVNFPMLVLTAEHAMERGIHPEEFFDWTREFLLAIKGKSETTISNYKEFGGQGSVKKEKTVGRIEEMRRHFEDYFKE